MLSAAVKNREVELRRELTDDEVTDVAIKEAKRRTQAVEAYEQAGREDLAARSEPSATCSPTTCRRACPTTRSPRWSTRPSPRPAPRPDVRHGKVMGIVMGRAKGRVDGAKVQAMVPGPPRRLMLARPRSEGPR
jgi:hypothetical protein